MAKDYGEKIAFLKSLLIKPQGRNEDYKTYQSRQRKALFRLTELTKELEEMLVEMDVLGIE